MFELGVLNGKDLLSAKYITAEITDSEDRIHYVPIKYTIGDFFITNINGKPYVFSLKNARILIYRQTLTRSFRVIQYDTSNFNSVKPEAKELELLLQKNSLPKMDTMMFKILRTLSKREKKEFEPHDIPKLMNEFGKHEGKYPDEVRNIQNYLKELDVEQIVTPCRKVTDFIENDLIATNPGFLGAAVPQLQLLDYEHKKMTNTPNKNSGGVMKMAVVILLVAMIGVGGYLAYDNGVFDGITQFGGTIGNIGDGLSGLPSPTAGFNIPTSGDYSDAALQAKYTPEALKAAINSGEIDYNKLSSNMKSLVDSID